MELSVQNGINVIEVDMMISSDGQIILKHGWDVDEQGNAIIESHDEFMSNNIDCLYTPMDIEALFEFMAKYEELYIVVDVKGGLEIYELMIDMAKLQRMRKCWIDLSYRYILETSMQT